MIAITLKSGLFRDREFDIIIEKINSVSKISEENLYSDILTKPLTYYEFTINYERGDQKIQLKSEGKLRDQRQELMAILLNRGNI